MFQMCLKRGIKNVVKRSYQSANESSWSSYLNYVWSGYILECPRCGEIYRSRQHWYGNKTPEECGVVDQENVHIWSGVRRIFGSCGGRVHENGDNFFVSLVFGMIFLLNRYLSAICCVFVCCLQSEQCNPSNFLFVKRFKCVVV